MIAGKPTIGAVALHSIGCRTNQEEISTLTFGLAQRGYSIVEADEEADIVIVNTCCVTDCTEIKTKRLIRQIALKAPHAHICVTGCLAQQKALPLCQLNNVQWVVGNARKHDIPSIIAGNATGIFQGQLHAVGAELSLPYSSVDSSVIRRTRFSIKIQEGCDFRCAYCIVPFVRGGSRSVAHEEIIAICQKAIQTEYKEIVLTGTHIGQYRDRKNLTLTDLVEKIAEIPGDFRVRISSLDPRDLSNPLIELITKHPRVCRHMHVSVQSLSQPVLSGMNRSAVDALSIVQRLRAVRTQYPTLGIGGDFIVGFPGESEDMFEQTVGNVQAVGFSYGHVFRYSRRPSTPAADMQNQVEEKEKSRRSERLRITLKQCRSAFFQTCKGAVQRIIVETENPVSGVSSNYLRIEVPNCNARQNEWRDVTLADLNKRSGRIIGLKGD